MKNIIKENISNPDQLEKIYQSDKKEFKKVFIEIYEEISEHEISRFWKTRLEFSKQSEKTSAIKKSDIFFLILTSFITGFLIKLPQLFDLTIDEDMFYLKNASLIVFFGLSYYVFLTHSRIKIKEFYFSLLEFVVIAIYMNLLPKDAFSDSINLAYIHLPLMLWGLLGIIYINFDFSNKANRIK